MPSKPDLLFFGLEEFVNEHIVSEPTVKKHVVKTSEAKASADKPKVVRKNFSSPHIKDWISDSKDGAESKPKIEKKTIKPSFAKIEFVKSKEQVNLLGKLLLNKNYAKKTHHCPKKNMIPKAVLIKSRLTTVNTARPVNATHPKSTENAAKSKTYFSKIAHSTVKRPFDKKIAFANSNVNQKVNNVKDKTMNTARPKAIVNAILGYNSYVVKASACWVWKPKTKVIDHVSKHNSASMIFKKFDYVDAQGRFNEQLWATVKAKTVTKEVQIQALVDGNKVIITESTKLTLYKVFFSLQWKFLIPTVLQCLSSKTTAWNEFSSTMSSVIICLAKNLKFYFSKYNLKSMVKNIDNMNKFLMYLRVGKGFSKRETPLFLTMMVQAQKEIGEGSTNRTDPHHTPTIIQPSTSQTQKTKKHRKPRRKVTEVPQPSDRLEHVANEAVYKEMDDRLVRAATTAFGLEAKPGIGAKKPWGILLLQLARVDSSDEASLGKDASKQEMIIDDIDADEGITLIDETTKNQGTFNDQKDAKMFFDVTNDLRAQRMQTKEQQELTDAGKVTLFMTELVVESSKEAKAEVIEGSSKRAGEKLEQKNTKNQNIKDDKESIELKQCLKIIPEDGDDVTIDAKPLSSKSLTIIDYKIYKEGMKSYF
nr:hypothetical protein [Tanacetum cinerariifolium]